MDLSALGKPLRKAPAPPVSNHGSRVLPELQYQMYAHAGELCVDVRRVFDVFGREERGYHLFAAADSLGQQVVVEPASRTGALLSFPVGQEADGTVRLPETLLIHVAEAHHPSIMYGCLSMSLPERLPVDSSAAPYRYTLAVPQTSLPAFAEALARLRTRLDGERARTAPESISVAEALPSLEIPQLPACPAGSCWRVLFLDALSSQL
jgi:hypothetical protein